MSAVTGRFVSQPAVVQGHLGKIMESSESTDHWDSWSRY